MRCWPILCLLVLLATNVLGVSRRNSLFRAPPSPRNRFDELMKLQEEKQFHYYNDYLRTDNHFISLLVKNYLLPEEAVHRAVEEARRINILTWETISFEYLLAESLEPILLKTEIEGELSGAEVVEAISKEAKELDEVDLKTKVIVPKLIGYNDDRRIDDLIVMTLRQAGWKVVSPDKFREEYGKLFTSGAFSRQTGYLNKPLLKEVDSTMVQILKLGESLYQARQMIKQEQEAREDSDNNLISDEPVARKDIDDRILKFNELQLKLREAKTQKPKPTMWESLITAFLGLCDTKINQEEEQQGKDDFEIAFGTWITEEEVIPETSTKQPEEMQLEIQWEKQKLEAQNEVDAWLCSAVVKVIGQDPDLVKQVVAHARNSNVVRHRIIPAPPPNQWKVCRRLQRQGTDDEKMYLAKFQFHNAHVCLDAELQKLLDSEFAGFTEDIHRAMGQARLTSSVLFGSLPFENLLIGQLEPIHKELQTDHRDFRDRIYKLQILAKDKCEKRYDGILGRYNDDSEMDDQIATILLKGPLVNPEEFNISVRKYIRSVVGETGDFTTVVKDHIESRYPGMLAVRNALTEARKTMNRQNSNNDEALAKELTALLPKFDNVKEAVVQARKIITFGLGITLGKSMVVSRLLKSGLIIPESLFAKYFAVVEVTGNKNLLRALEVRKEEVGESSKKEVGESSGAKSEGSSVDKSEESSVDKNEE